MFVFLLLLGILSILTGAILFKDSRNIIKEDTSFSSILKREDNYTYLDKRITELEKLFFNEGIYAREINDYQKENFSISEKKYEDRLEDIENEERLEENKIESNMAKLYKEVLEFEKQGVELTEICNILNMNKGEVLLLKNLYKD